MSDEPDSRKPEAADVPVEAAKPTKQPLPQAPEPHPIPAMHHADDHEEEDAERLKVYLTGPTAFCA